MSKTWASNSSPRRSPDEVAHRLDVDLGGQPLLDLGDDLELRGPLARVVQQPLRLGEQPRVLERDAHRRRDRREQALGGIRVGVLLEALEGEHAEDLVAHLDRDAQPRLGVRPGADRAGGVEHRRGPEPERLAGPDHVRGEARPRARTGRSGSAAPRRSRTGTRSRRVPASYMAMNIERRLELLADALADEVHDHVELELLASARPISLTRTSSALRWRATLDRPDARAAPRRCGARRTP